MEFATVKYGTVVTGTSFEAVGCAQHGTYTVFCAGCAYERVEERHTIGHDSIVGAALDADGYVVELFSADDWAEFVVNTIHSEHTVKVIWWDDCAGTMLGWCARVEVARLNNLRGE